MNFATIFTTFNPAEAQLMNSRLEAAGFHPNVKHELSTLSTEGYSLTTGGIKVEVPESEAVDARELVVSLTSATGENAPE